MTAPTTARPADAPESALSHRQILFVIGGLMMGMLLAALDQTIVSTALPHIVGDLGGLDHLSWVVTAYLLSSTASTPLYGKLSDLYGRRTVYRTAIVIFLVGSVLAGASQSMLQLVGSRAVQGLGGGGLISLAMAIVGDVIPPRQRGRYQGYFGAVFGISSVAGPLIGGFFSDSTLGWRWVFYINLPLGIAALVVTSAVLKHVPFSRREHVIDYAGATLMVGGVSSLLLVTVWGGTVYAWTSWQVITAAVLGVVLTVSFVLRERVAREPILPLRLFRDPVFSVSSGIAFLVGFMMFGSIIFLPLYLQVVDGASATSSGLQLVPLMLGVVSASVASGRLISRIGRYKAFPILGTALASVGLLLLSQLSVHTSRLVISADMALLGAGIGCVMQVLILAVQNSVHRNDLGIATSSNAFFRSMGGAFGTSVFGAVLSHRLTSELSHRLPGVAGNIGKGGATLLRSPEKLKLLPPHIHEALITSFVMAVRTVFLTAVPFAVTAFLLALALRESPLRDSPHVTNPAPSGGEVELEGVTA
ncbi:MAG: MFS transporter [Actinomycetota bacterium]|nr:MFS transporter [Actinomycetota bacterium]